MVEKRYGETTPFSPEKKNLNLKDSQRNSIGSWNPFPGRNIQLQKKPVLRILFLLIVAIVWDAGNQTAQAQVVRSFTERASFDQRGDIEMIGNALLTCAPGGSPDCAAVQNGSESDSNNRDMQFVNIDPSAGFTNSSSANLTLPAGATVLYAALYWGGRTDPSDTGRETIQFRVAGSASYTSVSADQLDTIDDQGEPESRPYLAFTDVTSLVQAAGNGTYFTGDLTAETGPTDGLGFYGGWSLIVIYQDDTQPFRRLTLFDGAVIVSAADNPSETITVSGLFTPVSGSFDTFMGALVWEGDEGISGDQFLLESTNVSNTLNTSTNFWNSSITRLDTRITDKNPDYVNQLAVDIDYVDASGILGNGATSAELEFNTTGDTYFPHALTFAVDLEAIDITLTGGPCWRMLSSPIDGLTYETMLDRLWTQGITNSDYDDPGAEPNVFIWPNGQSGNDPNDWQPLTDLDTVIPPGSGFLISVFDDDDFDGTGDGFDKVLTVSGESHIGDVSPPSMNSTDGGWTLVGNPYAEPVDFSVLIDPGNNNTNDLTDIAYVYDRNYTGSNGGPTNGNAGGWRSSDGTFGELIDGTIAVGQGFFVQNVANPTSPELTFTEASQTTGGEFYGKQSEQEQNEPYDYVRLELGGESLVNSLWIRFSEEGSVDPAYGDAVELMPLSEQYAIFGARKADESMVDIGHFPLTSQELEIPLAVQATLPGTYTISATRMDLPEGMQLTLYDMETGESILINDSSFKYSFSFSQAAKSAPDQGITPCSASPKKAKTTVEDRFLIIASGVDGDHKSELPEQVGLGQNYPNPFNPATVISYQLPVSSDVRLEVYDMAGRRVATLVEGTVGAGQHQVNFDANNLSSGVYLYRLTASGPKGNRQILTKKLTLIK